MIRIAQPTSVAPAWHATFIAMLPAIRRYARIAFRQLRAEARDEAIQAVICNACAAVARLAELGKLGLAYATVLARYGVAQVRDGRMTGGHLNCRDVLSRHCQRYKNITVERLDHFDPEENQWREAVVTDTRTSPVPETVGFRVDFADWLTGLPRHKRRVAEYLSLGNRTGEAASRFGLSAGRVSQLRTELAASWQAFVGDGGEVVAENR